MLKPIVEICKNFGFDFALVSLLSGKLSVLHDLKHKKILNYLRENYGDVIFEYKKKVSNETQQSNVIWTMWWQGDRDEDLPEVVKLCFSMMRKFRGNNELKILTKYNVHEYVELPEHIMEKFSQGKISMAHFSDIIRAYLLSRYGGLWLDATVLVTDEIPSEIFKLKYFTVKRNFIPGGNITHNRWMTFLQSAGKGSKLFNFIYDFFVAYCKKEDCFIDYLLQDYLLHIAMEEFPECKRDYDAISMNNLEIFTLHDFLMNKEWDEKIFNDVKKDTRFFKLKWKTKYKKSIHGKETFYGHFIGSSLQE